MNEKASKKRRLQPDQRDLELVSVLEVTKLLKVSETTVYDWARCPSKAPYPLRPVRLGRRILFRASELRAMIEDCTDSDGFSEAV